ncbi:aspartate--tRNA(Asn) ligase [Candidatus Poribacteria bacterium]
MKRVLTSELKRFAGQKVIMQGWIHRTRTLGQVMFIVLRDRGGLGQLVLEGQGNGSANITNESIVQVEGIARLEDRALGGAELQVSDLKLMGQPVETPPIAVNSKDISSTVRLDTVLKHRAISLRNPQIRAVFKVQAEIIDAFRAFLINHDFTEISTPKIVSSATEGGAELFSIQYFEETAYLAQSPQFYKQMMVGSGFERVFEVGKAYRAESHNTVRHINEFVSLDYEMGFIQDEQDVIDLEVKLLKYVFDRVRENCPEELTLYDAHTPEIAEIPQIRLAEAKEKLKQLYGTPDGEEGDLSTKEERLLCEYSQREYGSELIYVTHYPRTKRPAYAMPDSEDPTLTRSFDLLLRGLEITTGGQRIHQYDLLVESLRGRGFDISSFEGYLEAFKYGMPPHGGLAIGAERLTMKLLGLKNIREACLFPRDRTRLTP